MEIKQKVSIEKKGIVVSDKMDKTRVVLVETMARHPKYLKIIKKRKKFYVHDEGNISKEGDIVIIRQCRPLSKLKRWKLVEVVKQATSRKEGVINGATENNT
ncbi:MAG: 30S ribosomal protein S17 [Candidatus Omnitrophica bacterium]|jgi:small subunit ribosomal protein S17|nr:30S ribosomal protein S17 [Candidatus Omnitrophota bacterium]